MHNVFFDPPLTRAQSRKLLEPSIEKFQSNFINKEQCESYLSGFISPKSKAWVFIANGKAGSTSALDYLFELEFRSKSNIKVNSDQDINEDVRMHSKSHIFRRLHQRSDIRSIHGAIRRSLYINMVRHPAQRAASAFRYICKSQQERAMHFANERMRLTALTGFDWDAHMNTVDGFIRFLNYLRISQEHNDGLIINPHWIPQYDRIRPDVIKPDLIGRVENFGAFTAELAERLNKPAPEGPPPHRNSQGESDMTEAFLANPDARRLIEQCYAKDFEAFGYDL